MKRPVSGMVMIIVLTAATVLLSVSSYAEEGTVKAMSPWKGQGFAFPVGPDQVYMVVVYSGVMLMDDGKGPMHAATLVCPGTVDADLKKGTKTGHAKCVITGEQGDRVFAELNCTGDVEGCRGPFKLTGGTGKFAGITGEGEMISKILGREITMISGVETAHQLGEGVAVWPKLTYRIPDNR
jgi:hypothetical protein